MKLLKQLNEQANQRGMELFISPQEEGYISIEIEPLSSDYQEYIKTEINSSNEVDLETGLQKARNHFDKLVDSDDERDADDFDDDEGHYYDDDDINDELDKFKTVAQKVGGGKFYYSEGGPQNRYGSTYARLLFVK